MQSDEIININTYLGKLIIMNIPLIKSWIITKLLIYSNKKLVSQNLRLDGLEYLGRGHTRLTNICWLSADCWPIVGCPSEHTIRVKACKGAH